MCFLCVCMVCKTDFSSERMEAKKQWNNIFKAQRKNSVNSEFYIQWKYLSKMNVKQRHFQIQERQENSSLGDSSKRNATGSASDTRSRSVVSDALWLHRLQPPGSSVRGILSLPQVYSEDFLFLVFTCMGVNKNFFFTLRKQYPFSYS